MKKDHSNQTKPDCSAMCTQHQASTVQTCSSVTKFSTWDSVMAQFSLFRIISHSLLLYYLLLTLVSTDPFTWIHGSTSAMPLRYLQATGWKPVSQPKIRSDRHNPLVEVHSPCLVFSVFMWFTQTQFKATPFNQVSLGKKCLCDGAHRSITFQLLAF